MAMTETRPAEAADPVAPTSGAGDPSDALRPTGGLAGLLGSGDHNVVGRLWIATAVVFLLGAGTLGILLGAERIDTTTYDVFEGPHYLQAFSLHAVTGLFLFAIPMLIGVATIVTPRQVGARTIAFPRAAALAYWAYLVGGALVIVSYLMNGGVGGGRQNGVDLFIASLGLVCVAMILASVCLATTIVGLRTAGLRLDRVPAFSWSILVASSIWIISLGFLAGELLLLYLDNRYRLFAFADANALGAWLYWTSTPPQVFAVAIPVLGFAVEVVPVFAGRRPRHRGVLLGAIGAFGAFSFGAWTYDQVQSPALTRQALFVAFAFGALLPVLIVLGGVGDSLVKGRPKPSSPLLFAVAALLMLDAGVAAAALRAVEPFHLVATTADASAAHYALGAAALTGFGALHYWWPQILRRPLNEAIGRTTAALALLGTIGLALPDIITGFLDEPRGSLTPGGVRDGVQALNIVSLVGGSLLALAVVLLVFNLGRSLGKRGSVEPDADPWDGHTLEWAADPATVPVTSAAPLLDQKEAADT